MGREVHVQDSRNGTQQSKKAEGRRLNEKG
jgi:hypothetical protein